MIKNEIDINEIMRDKWKIFQSKFDGGFTKTTQFMLPSIDITITPALLKAFKNAFLNDVNHEHNYDRALFLLFTIHDLKLWYRINVDLIKNPNYVNDYNVGVDDEGKDLVMYVFKVPEKYKEDYYNFRR